MRSLLLIVVLAGYSGVVFAQAAPVKMGLWEKKMTMDMGTGEPRQINSKSCVTPESWQEMWWAIRRSRMKVARSTGSRMLGYTFTSTCKTPNRGTMVTSGSETIQDSQHIVSESHTVVTENGNKRQMEVKSTSSFLSGDCGKIKPGEPESE